MSQRELSASVNVADAHGVLPAVTRNLRKILTCIGARSIGSDPDADVLIRRTLAALDERLVLVTGHSLLLAHHERRITSAIRKKGLDGFAIKGPVFARRLYENVSDRSFTDIDILVSPQSLRATAEILYRLGFVEAQSSHKECSVQSEFKWLLSGNDAILVEIQTDLVHSNVSDSRLHLTFADMQVAGNGNPEDATALLLVAAVHGIAGHQFERLQPAVDVLQAVREQGGAIDETRLIRAASATGAKEAVQTALDVVAGIFDEPQASRLANLLKPSRWRRLRAGLLSPAVVLRSQAINAGRDSWRRRSVRKLVR
jgi:hypothetical protein